MYLSYAPESMRIKPPLAFTAQIQVHLKKKIRKKKKKKKKQICPSCRTSMENTNLYPKVGRQDPLPVMTRAYQNRTKSNTCTYSKQTQKEITSQTD